jgi:hypothetical protein
MATIRQEIVTSAAPRDVWDALCDFGAVHERVARGFVVDTQMQGEDRVVTFANGLVAREVVVARDDDALRFVYSARSDALTHHNAAVQVFADDAGSRIVWTADVLPDAVAPHIAAMMHDGAASIRLTFDGVRS